MKNVIKLGYDSDFKDILFEDHQGNLSINVIINSRKLLLTSRYNYNNEISRLINKINTKVMNRTIIIFGLGTGKFLTHLLEETHDSVNIIIFEPSNEIFLNFTQENNNIIQDDRIYFIVGNRYEDTLTKMNNINTLLVKGDIYTHGNYRNIWNKDYNSLLNYIRNISFLNLTNRATMKVFNEKFTSNVFENLYANRFLNTINDFKSKFENVPALIVSAGPSLTKNFNKIKDFNGIIISGGRTLNMMIDSNVKPHIFISIDPGENAYKLVIEAKEETKIPLFTMLESNSRIVKEYKGPKVIMNSKNIRLGEYFFNSQVDYIDNGASVANSSFSLAQYLGCNPIIFIGQDLAYTDNKHHSDAAVSNFDSENDVSLKEGIYVDGYYGGRVKTSSSLYTFLNWFEQKIEDSECSVINCTEGGAAIRGTIQKPFSDIISLYKGVDFNIENRIEHILSEQTFELRDNLFKDIEEKLLKCKKIVRRGKSLSIDLKQLIKNSSSQNKVMKILNNIDEQDLKIKELGDTNRLINYLVNDVMVDIENYNNIKDSTVIKERELLAQSNLLFYEKLEEKMNFILDLIRGLDKNV